MSSKVKVLRSTVAGKRPTGKEFGELWVNDKDKVMGYIDSGGQPVVPFALPSDIVIHKFNATVAYRPGDVVLGPDGELWIAKAAVVAGAWDATKWNHSGDSRFVNLTGDTMTGPLHVPDWSASPAGNTDDIAMNHKSVAAMIQVEQTARVREDGLKVAKAGDTMTGALNLPATAPTVATHATTKKYVDDQDALKVSKAGDTLTGALNLPTGVPTGNNAVSRTEGDKLYVNVSGDTMTGALNLPADGLTVGTNQLVVKGGNLGIGATSSSGTVTVQATGGPSLALRRDLQIPGENTLGNLSFLGRYDASTYGTGASISAVGQHGSAWSSTSTPAYLSFNTTAVGSTTPTEKMRVDSSGNLGLGVTPSGWISAYSAIDLGTTGAVYGRNDSSVEVSLTANAYRNSAGNWVYKLTDHAGQFGYDTSGAWNWKTAPSGTAGAPITFKQAMTLDESGNLGLGGAIGFEINGARRAAISADRHTAAGQLTDLVFATMGANRMWLDYQGDLTINGSTATKASGTTWANPSDARLKDNIQPFAKGLNELLKVDVKTWEYNGKGGTVAGAKGLGVIADEVMQVLPDTVDTYSAKLNPDDEEEIDIKRFDATEITWLLVNAIKEQQALITDLQTRLAALEAKS